jgi:hypothetical protein
MDIQDWVIVGAGSVASAACFSQLYAHRVPRRAASGPDKDRATWYWVGMTMICLLSTLSVLVRYLGHDTAAWTALSAACAIACTNVVLWTVKRRGERSRHHPGFSDE